MKRSCRFCGKWHFDFNCRHRPQSYHLTYKNDQAKSDDDDVVSSESESDDSIQEFSDISSFARSSAPVGQKEVSHHHTSYSNDYRRIKADRIRLPQAQRYKITEIPSAFSVGTGISYLCAEPCPIRAWIGAEPSQEEELKSGIADSGGASLIEKDLVSEGYEIKESPLLPEFSGIGKSRTSILGYVVLPVYLPNVPVMSGDERHGEVVKIMIEFQIVEHCPAGFLIGRDALKGYKITIDEDHGHLIFNKSQDGVTRILIVDGLRYDSTQFDPRIRAIHAVIVRPNEGKWVPVQIDYPAMEADQRTPQLFVTPVRYLNAAEGTYGSCLYALVPPSAKQLWFFNPSFRPVRIHVNDVVAICESFKPNTSYSYFLTPKSDNPISSDPTNTVRPSEQSTEPPIGVPIPPSGSSDETKFTINRSPDGNMFIHRNPFVQDKKDEEIEIISPFGLEKEFQSSGPILSPPLIDAEPKHKDDLNWDINPFLNRKQRRQMQKLLRKHRIMFAGSEGKLGEVKAPEFEMSIEVDETNLRSQQFYRISPRKRKLIKEAIEKLESLGVIEPSKSPFASPVIVVMQHGKPRFYVDLREVNAKTITDKYALSRQDVIFASLGDCLFFTGLDNNKGYHQLRVGKESRKYTAFVTEDHGFWQFIRIPFGLKNAPAHFQRVVDIILRRFRWDFVLIYIDDIIIYSKTWEDHLKHVHQVFSILAEIGFTVDEKKCHFGYEDLKLLGHQISRLNLATQEEKVTAITALIFSTMVQEVLVTMGQFNYYRSFIERYAEIAESITSELGLQKKQENRRRSLR